jgi:hypothetical protein
MNETKDSETNPPVVLASGETTNGRRLAGPNWRAEISAT